MLLHRLLRQAVQCRGLALAHERHFLPAPSPSLSLCYQSPRAEMGCEQPEFGWRRGEAASLIFNEAAWSLTRPTCFKLTLFSNQLCPCSLHLECPPHPPTAISFAPFEHVAKSNILVEHKVRAGWSLPRVEIVLEWWKKRWRHVDTERRSICNHFSEVNTWPLLIIEHQHSHYLTIHFHF